MAKIPYSRQVKLVKKDIKVIKDFGHIEFIGHSGNDLKSDYFSLYSFWGSMISGLLFQILLKKYIPSGVCLQYIRSENDSDTFEDKDDLNSVLYFKVKR